MRSTPWLCGLFLATLVGIPAGNFLFEVARADGGGQTPPVKMTKEEDHQRLMNLLHMTEIRRGRDGNNKESPYYANYDESKANPYPGLPDPLTLKNGRKVTKAADWWSKRRPEIVEDFDREVYGRVPKVTPKVNWVVTSTTNAKNGDVDVITKKLEGVVDNSSYPDIEVKIALTLTTPAHAKGPVPVVMQFAFIFGAPQAPPPAGPPYGPNAFLPPRPPMRAAVPRGPLPGRGPTGPTWQQQVLAKGWGYAQTDPQQHSGRQRRRPDARHHRPGEQRPAAQARRLGRPARLGLGRQPRSRLFRDRQGRGREAGRARRPFALRQGDASSRWPMTRASWTAYVSSSGEGGAKLHRRNWGEIVENVAGSSEYHWMAGNFLKYAGPLHWNDLPVDSHELVAMCAPRPVFLSAGATNGDGWVDAKGTFLAGVGAGPVYKLLGKKDLGTTEFPPIETLLGDGDVAFRQHAQGHTDAPNWPFFLDFASKHMSLN